MESMQPPQQKEYAQTVDTATVPTISRRRWIIGGISIVIVVVLVVIGIRMIKKQRTPLTPLQQLEVLDKETYQLDQLPPKELKTTLQELKKNSVPSIQSKEQQQKRLEALMNKKQ